MKTENKPKRKTKTSSEVKNRYNKKTYKTYAIVVRQDSGLFQSIEQYRAEHYQGFNSLVIGLLEKYFK